MKPLDIAPFSLPNCAPGEVRFEEPRDISLVEVSFRGRIPDGVGLSYLQKTWPETRAELFRDTENPCVAGWTRMDDWFNVSWRPAAADVEPVSARRLRIAFRGLAEEFPDRGDYDVTFRRTLGIRLDIPRPEDIRGIAVFTTSEPCRTRLRVRMNAGRKSPSGPIRVEGHNAAVQDLAAGTGVSVREGAIRRGRARGQSFEVDVAHMRPASDRSGDDGHVQFVFERDAFTVSLGSLEREGPVWFADMGVYITRADADVPFEEYRRACRGRRTVAQLVAERPEQSYGAAFLGQPRPHAVAFSLGCRHARQRFWLDPNGDLTLARLSVTAIPGPDTPRYANDGEGRFFFGLEDWPVLGRFPDPAPVLAYNIHLRRDGLRLEQKAFAMPLDGKFGPDGWTGDRPLACLVRFRFTNEAAGERTAKLSIRYSSKSGRSPNPLSYRSSEGGRGGWAVPDSPAEELTLEGGRIYSRWHGRSVLRCAFESSMSCDAVGGVVGLMQTLRPGESCEALLRVPHISLINGAERAALDRLDFCRCYEALAAFWRAEAAAGAQIRTPVPQLDDLHRSHLAYVQISDSAIPGEPDLVNTSVGTSTYGNFTNESCMINQELDQRGLAGEARRRLQVWVRYQGTVPQPGNFTDYNGMYFGAGGYEMGSYNQHHGWALWRLAEHFLYARDREWFASVADSVIEAADWVFRQRRNTMQPLPHSRGWERGFLPAGSLEDVTDFHYWLSTNALTWRGVDTAARALEVYGHPDAPRVRRAADAYRTDLRRGFETMRRHSPLIRLRDGRWVPHYPSRLYCRGRDRGWIREVLEGSVYLLISGLYNARGKRARWILDDYQDTRYMNPPFGYPIVDEALEWYDRGGFSIQPNLLAGLLPYLDRDEPEVYIWMFFNAWCSCYREEINAMIEHPWPTLGYSNTAHPKTSDEANAVMWLRYMFVYANADGLYLGRAVPRAWFAGREPFCAQGVRTVYGVAGVTYRADADAKRITAEVALDLHEDPERILLRFRHPDRAAIVGVRVNGRPHMAFDAAKGDVDVSGLSGKFMVEARYA
jgi:hypothetical protein